MNTHSFLADSMSQLYIYVMFWKFSVSAIMSGWEFLTCSSNSNFLVCARQSVTIKIFNSFKYKISGGVSVKTEGAAHAGLSSSSGGSRWNGIPPIIVSSINVLKW